MYVHDIFIVYVHILYTYLRAMLLPTKLWLGSGGGVALDDMIVVANKADLAEAQAELAGGAGDEAAQALKALALAAAKRTLPSQAGVGGGAGVGIGMGVAAGVAGGREELGSGGGAAGGGERERDGEEEEGRVWKLSCKTKEGVDGFMEHLEAEVRSRFQGAADDESPLITRYRLVRYVYAP